MQNQQDDSKELLVQSSDYGKNLKKIPLLGLNFSASGDQLDFADSPLSQDTKFIHGGIYTVSDQTLYSYRLSIGNSSFIDLKLIGKKKLNETVASVHAIKQKG